MLLGSVTEKVLRRAPCPVLIVGKVKAASPGGPLFRKILCAADLATSGPVIDFALSLAEENQAELTLLNVIESLPSETSGAKLYLAVPEIGPLRRELTEQSKERLREAVPDEARQWCEVKELVKVGAAWRAILRAAEETSADLIVMGARAHGPIGRMFFGSTTSQVVSHSPCPVLVVRETKALEPSRSEGGAEAAVTVVGGADRAKGKGDKS
jgi:nucleotide-binding universal stress UspA family protein